MIYITQLLFVKKDKEESLIEFEEHVLPLMEKHTGKIMYRLRPNKESYVSFTEEEIPFEIHIISFDNEDALQAYLDDDNRLQFMRLKEEAIKSTLTIKGQEI